MSDGDTVYDKKQTRKKSPLLLYAVIALIILIAAGTAAAGLYYKYLQYAEEGVRYIYMLFTDWSAQFMTQGASFATVFVFFLVNNIFLRKNVYDKNKDLSVVRKPFMLVVITVIIAFIASRIISSNVYLNFLTFTHNVKFNKTDPLFNRDLSYYIFQRPFYMAVVESVKGILLLNVVYTLFIYLLMQLRGGVGAVKHIFKERGVPTHCIVNVMLYIVAVALSFKFAAEDILFGEFCGVTGAGFIDIKIWRMYYIIAPFFLIIIVPLVIYFLRRSEYKMAVICMLSFPAIWLITYFAATVGQSAIVDADELAKEQQYIQYNIDMTRSAFDLDSVEETETDLANDLTYKDIDNERGVITNTVVADMAEYLKGVNKQQSLGNYYKFNDSDLVPYEIDGEKTLVAVSARELDMDKLSGTTESYVNKTFKYTHSTGVTVSDVRSGKEQFVVKDIPTLSNVGFPRIEQPRIYYGETMNNTVVVNTNYSEVDYMNAESSAYSYEGFGGIQMTALNRCVLAICQRDYQMLVSGQITSQSRALINRSITDRVKRIAPFFLYDSDPYIIVTSNGELKWVIDVYTATDKYPYSENIGGINYIRCPAKAVIDAYNGDVSFYITDPEDVFVQTYKSIYPTLFEDGDIPESIAEHLRYPQDIFKIRAELYKSYHITDAAEFYGKNDVWDFAKENGKNSDTRNVVGYYSTGEDGITLNALYTPHRTNDINYVLSVGSEKNNYGTMTINRINRTDESTFGTMYAEKTAEEDSIVSEQLNALKSGGGEVVIGDMQLIRIKNSYLYVSPVYVTNKSNSAAYPEMKKVIVVYDNKAAAEDTLMSGLEVIFGKKETDTTAVSDDDEQSVQQLIDDIIDMYEGYKQYNTANDWENAGKAMTELDKNINELKNRRGELDEIKPFVGPINRED